MRDKKSFEIDLEGEGNLRHAYSNEHFAMITENIKHEVRPDQSEFSTDTIGLYVFLRLLPPTWKFSVKGLIHILGKTKSERAVRKELETLEKYGYLLRVHRRNAQGQLGSDYFWVTLDNPDDYEEVVSTLEARGGYIYRKRVEGINNKIKKSQVGTDDAYGATLAATCGNANTNTIPSQLDERHSDSDVENMGKSISPTQQFADVDIIKSQVRADGAHGATLAATRDYAEDVMERSRNCGEKETPGQALDCIFPDSGEMPYKPILDIKPINEDNLDLKYACAMSERAKPERLARSSQQHIRNSTCNDIPVGTEEPETRSWLELTREESENLNDILGFSPNQERPKTEEEKNAVRSLFAELIRSGLNAHQIKADWFDVIKLRMKDIPPSSGYPVLIDWLHSLQKPTTIENGANEAKWNQMELDESERADSESEIFLNTLVLENDLDLIG